MVYGREHQCGAAPHVLCRWNNRDRQLLVLDACDDIVIACALQLLADLGCPAKLVTEIITEDEQDDTDAREDKCCCHTRYLLLSVMHTSIVIAIGVMASILSQPGKNRMKNYLSRITEVLRYI